MCAMATYFKYFFRVLSAIVIFYAMTMHILESDPFKQISANFGSEVKRNILLLSVRPQYQKDLRLSSRIANTTIGIIYTLKVTSNKSLLSPYYHVFFHLKLLKLTDLHRLILLQKLIHLT